VIVISFLHSAAEMLRVIDIVLLTILLSIIAQGQLRTKPDVRAAEREMKSTATLRYAVLSINNLTSWMRSDGHSNHSPGGDDGLTFPAKTGSAIYQDGIVWGGKMFRDSACSVPYSSSQYNQNVRVGGGTYGIGTRAGAVIGFGVGATPENIDAPDVRVYRIRRDYASLSSSDLAYDAQAVNELRSEFPTETMMAQVTAQYTKDWLEWPVHKGAPFIDRNRDGVFDPPPAFNTDPNAGPLFTVDSLIAGNYDEPGIAGADLSLPADQVLWTVYNDLDVYESISFAGSLPLGLEVQKTVWAYKEGSSNRDFYFQRHRLINKGGVDTSDASGDQLGAFWVDSMYIAQWSDADLGNAGDDVVGCDTVRHMGYAYNANQSDGEYAGFGLPPPAVAYDILAGPTVPAAGDSGIVGLRFRKDVRNLSMTSFLIQRSFFEAPEGYSAVTGLWWKSLRGYADLPSISSADTYQSYPVEVGPSFYPVSGDPVFHSGWLDGMGTTYSPSPGDRRFVISTGPFRLAPGDTQELYVGVVLGLGSDRVSSISAMRANDRVMQGIFDREFQVPIPPDTPAVRAVEYDRTIFLEWGSNARAVHATEDKVIAGRYAFEGYTVYQLPSEHSALSDGVRIATFDRVNSVGDIVEDRFDHTSGLVIPVLLQAGVNAGVKRTLNITQDKLAERAGASNTALANGQEYVFAVTAYNVSTASVAYPVSLESEPVIFKVKPRIPFGLQPSQSYGDTLAVRHVAGNGTGTVIPGVIDPLEGTGDTYRITFQPSVTDSLVWSLENRTKGTVVASAQRLAQTGEEPLIVEGSVMLGISMSPGPLSPADTFEYTVPAPASGRAVEIESVKRIGVFPNPYYAEIVGWSMYGGRQRQYVTFNNLPQRAVFRIFNLAGHLVRTLRKDDASQFFEWDLMNENGWLVASGIYICHVELPDLSHSKTLKLVVIPSR